MTRLLVVFVACIFLSGGCRENPLIPEEPQLVLQAYLYADRPVTDVGVMLSNLLSSSDLSNTPISDASVVLWKDGARYQLTASTQTQGNHYYAGTNLSVRSGDRFRIEVSRNGITAFAETDVPQKPVNVSTSHRTLTFVRSTFTTPFGMTMEIVNTSDTMMVLWNNPEKHPYYVVVESADPNSQPLRSDTVMSRRFRFVTEPTINDYFRILPVNIAYTGIHKVTLYRVNQEYVDLYKSRQQDSRSLNEPLTNIRNGLGIFTAFSSDSLFVTVVLE